MIAVDLSQISYDEGLAYQEKVHALRVADKIDDVLFLLEHNHVITIGKSGEKSDLLQPEETLIRQGIEVRHLSRGGKITCHYPGQLVVYPIMKLEPVGIDIPRYVCNLEETIIQTLAEFGIEGKRIPKMRGIFVGNDKVAAVGVEVKKSVSMHGLALNIKEDKTLYRLFVPCGIRNRGVTFLENVSGSGRMLDMDEIKSCLVHKFSKVFDVSIAPAVTLHEFQNKYLKNI